MDKSKKEQVRDLLKSIETGDFGPIAFINASKYTQHNLGVADGLAGFGALMQQLPKGSAKVETVRIFQDGDLVFAHTDYDFFWSGFPDTAPRRRRSSREILGW
jgi:predicted SnoaL-like aldol condensation-catalyzing enzyme